MKNCFWDNSAKLNIEQELNDTKDFTIFVGSDDYNADT